MSKKINSKTPDGQAISVPEQSVKPGLGLVGDGAMGSGVFSENTQIDATPVVVKTKQAKTIALHSSRNVSWQGVGEVTRGYNIVSEVAAEKWLTRNHIRIATPEEVAGAYKN